MGEIIRPAINVFQRQMPLVVVFGGSRLYNTQDALSEDDVGLVCNVVSAARKFRVPLAFSRCNRAKGLNVPPSYWLPECRPKVSDRVFEHPEPSCFSSAEFGILLNRLKPRLTYLVGPRGDSCLSASFADSSLYPGVFRVIRGSTALRFCSGVSGKLGVRDPFAPQSGHEDFISFSEWIDALRIVEPAG